MTTHTATTALPYPHLERATAGLRAELRRQMTAAGDGEPPRWDALEVTGPAETTDARARTWYEYRGALEVSLRQF